MKEGLNFKPVEITNLYTVEGTELSQEQVNTYREVAKGAEFKEEMEENGYVQFLNYIPNIDLYIIKDHKVLDLLKSNGTIQVGDVEQGLWDFQDDDGCIVAFRKIENTNL